MKKCLVYFEYEENNYAWFNASLSDEDIQAIQNDIDGILQSQYNITLDNGEQIETGIIDDYIILEEE